MTKENIDKIFILFLCPGNTCRSPMAAAITKHQLGDGYICESAGINEKIDEYVAENAIQALEELECGIILNAKTRKVSAGLIEKADLIFCINNNALNQMKEAFPEHVKKFLRYAPDLEGTPDPYDLQHFDLEEKTKYESKTIEAYKFVAAMMRDIYTPEAIARLKD
ncbi:MAG: protein-tyrosine phosphatase [Lentimonas sp.]|jgi:protein-tyrosine phosphatase